MKRLAPCLGNDCRFRALWAAGLAAALLAGPVFAQSTDLRGQVTEANVLDQNNQENQDQADRPIDLSPPQPDEEQEPRVIEYVPATPRSDRGRDERGQDDASQPTPGFAPAPVLSPGNQQVNDGQDARASAIGQRREAILRADAASDATPAGIDRVGTANPDTAVTDYGRTGVTNTAQGPIEGLNRPAENDPFAPVGLRLGTFDVNVTAEQGLSYTTNANRQPGSGSATVSETQLRVRANSDWSRHSARWGGFAAFRKSISGETVEDIEGNLNGGVTLDLTDGWQADVSGDYNYLREQAEVPGLTGADSENESTTQTLIGRASLERTNSKLLLRGAIDVTRQIYGDVEFANGNSFSQSDRDNSLVVLSLRAGYEVSPAITPFVEGSYGWRIFDDAVDNDGFDRSGVQYSVRGGVAFDFQEKLRGEIAGGWIAETQNDERLSEIAGFALNGRLEWSPERDTLVTFNASTSIDIEDEIGDPASVAYLGGVEINRQLRADLTGSLRFDAEYLDFVGDFDNQLTLFARGEVTWWMNRQFGLRGRATYERLLSDDPSVEYNAAGGYVGVVWQR